MGYYTYFHIKLENDVDDNVTKHIESGDDYVRSALFSGENMKWYGWQEWLQEATNLFPQAKITITGEGEESGDLWRAYAHQGTVQVSRAELRYDPPFWEAQQSGWTSV